MDDGELWSKCEVYAILDITIFFPNYFEFDKSIIIKQIVILQTKNVSLIQVGRIESSTPRAKKINNFHQLNGLGLLTYDKIESLHYQPEI